MLEVEIVDDCDAELADHARAWLATVSLHSGGGDEERQAAIRKVREALQRHDERKAAA